WTASTSPCSTTAMTRSRPRSSTCRPAPPPVSASARSGRTTASVSPCPPWATTSGCSPTSSAAPCASSTSRRSREDGGLLGLHLLVPVLLDRPPGLVVGPGPPVAGDRQPVHRDAEADPQVAAELLDEPGLAVHERLHLAGRAGERAHRLHQGLPHRAVAPVEPGDLDVAGRAELDLLFRPRHLDEREPAGSLGQRLQGGGDAGQRALVTGEQMPV